MERVAIRTITLLFLLPIMMLGQIRDHHISSTTEKYFNRNRTAPTLISTDIVNDLMYGRTLKITIRGHRNSENQDLGFAFGAAAAIANQASTPFEALWVEMDIRYKQLETTIAVAPAHCSIDAIVRKSRSYDSWWEECLEIL